MDASVKTILFLGPTGSGKGVQSKLLSEKTGFSIFSTGGRYRELRLGDSDLAVRIREQYDGGLLMPAWFSSFLFEECFINKSLHEGVICEGVGRRIEEVTEFDEVMEWLRRPYIMFCLNITEEESLKRQMSRNTYGTELRPESDSEEKIRVRFKEYHTFTGPAIEYVRNKGRVIDLDGMRSVEEIHADVLKHLDQ